MLSSRVWSLDICSRRRTRCTVTTAPVGRRYTTLTAAIQAVRGLPRLRAPGVVPASAGK